MQSELRNRSDRYQKDCGVKSNFICTKLGIDPAYFCRWRKGQKLLNDKHSASLDAFLLSKGY